MRLDAVDPMMFVIDLKQNSYLPISQKNFMIPQNKLPEDPAVSGPLIFWVDSTIPFLVIIYFNNVLNNFLGSSVHEIFGLHSVFLRSRYQSGRR